MKNILIEPIILLCSEVGKQFNHKIFDAHPKVCAPGASHLFRVSHEFNAKIKLDKRQTVNAIIKLFRAKIAHWQIDEFDDTQIRTALLDCSSSEQMCALLYNLECLIQKSNTVS